ncbi:MAG: RNA polymerase sigma factor [Planctomycetota bacterium]
MRDEFTRIAPRVFRFLLKLSGNVDLAGDLAQETLTRAWLKRYQLRQPQAFNTWVFRIAIRIWNDHQNPGSEKRNPAGECDIASISLIDPNADDPSENLQRNEMQHRLQTFTDQLPARQRQVLLLRVLEEMSIREIAEAVGITDQNARSNLAAARKKLRQRWEHDESTTSPSSSAAADAQQNE